ncbi:MAG: GNAT family N-acetyltransferase [Jatrophihabitans sp.]
MPSPTDQQLLSGFANSRDFGGLPTRSGGVTAYGVLVRSNVPRSLSAEQADAAHAVGFGRVIDLRSMDEVAHDPHPFAGLDGYRHCPLIDPAAEALRDESQERGRGDTYAGSVDRNGQTIAAVMSAIADTPSGPILVSCAAGMDRTGMIAALLLELAGVTREAIGADYQRTEQLMRGEFERGLQRAPDAATRQRWAQLCTAPPENILQMLDHLDEADGSVAGYLASIGLEQAQISRLAVLLVEPPLTTRPFQDGDQAGVDALLDDDADPLFVAQAHALHGPEAEGSHTVVAIENGQIVGALSVARNRVHPGRYSFAVEVAAAHRRRGIGRRLTGAALALRADARPLAAKVRPADPAATGLIRAFDGRTYQRCDGLRVDVQSAAIADWCAARVSLDAAVAISLEGLQSAELAAAWVEQYRWVHEAWSPVDEDVLAGVTPSVLADLEPGLSAAVRLDGRLRAIAWVFAEAPGTVAVVAETVQRDEPDATALVASTLARCFAALRAAGIAHAEIDGHVGDPHLQPVCTTLPPSRSNPLLLVELG